MKLKINNQNLFIEKAYINGQWVDADDNSTLNVINPVNQEIIGHVPNCGATETNAAITTAAAAQKKWEQRPAKEKASVLRNFYDLICSNQDDLAKILTYEQGKPLAEAAEKGQEKVTAKLFTDLAREVGMDTELMDRFKSGG